MSIRPHNLPKSTLTVEELRQQLAQFPGRTPVFLLDDCESAYDLVFEPCEEVPIKSLRLVFGRIDPEETEKGWRRARRKKRPGLLACIIATGADAEVIGDNSDEADT